MFVKVVSEISYTDEFEIELFYEYAEFVKYVHLFDKNRPMFLADVITKPGFSYSKFNYGIHDNFYKGPIKLTNFRPIISLKEWSDVKFQMSAVKLNEDALNYIKDPSDEVKLAAVSAYSYSINYIKNPSEELQLIAVGNNAESIKVIENPCKKAQLAAVRTNGYLIKYINNPSTEVQLEAVKNNGLVIKYIRHPPKKTIIAAINQNISVMSFDEVKSSICIQLAAVKEYKIYHHWFILYTL